MTDREKVIKGLECCNSLHNDSIVKCATDCPYWEFDAKCRGFVMRDALALLKAQEPVEPKIIDTVNSKLYHNDMFKNYYCGNCGEFLHVVNRKDMFCSQCGQEVKWE